MHFGFYILDFGFDDFGIGIRNFGFCSYKLNNIIP